MQTILAGTITINASGGGALPMFSIAVSNYATDLFSTANQDPIITPSISQGITPTRLRIYRGATADQANILDDRDTSFDAPYTDAALPLGADLPQYHAVLEYC